MADATDLKSVGLNGPCRFESGHRQLHLSCNFSPNLRSFRRFIPAYSVPSRHSVLYRRIIRTSTMPQLMNRSMKFWQGLALPLVITFCAFSGCKKGETFTAEEIAAAAKLKPATDPAQDEIYDFRFAVHQDHNHRRFADLEQRAAALRRARSLFGNGSWKISEFYESLSCRSDEPESMWQLHDRIHHDWIAAFPQSVTARTAYADFLVSYAWQAHGHGFANTVTAKGWQLFKERIATARRALEGAFKLPERDPVWWRLALEVGHAQGWRKDEYDRAVDAATSSEPRFLGV